MKRRMGTFSISRQLVDEQVSLGDMSVLNDVFKDLVVVSVSFHYPSDTFIYHAISPLFEEIGEGEEPNVYTCDYDSIAKKATWRKR